MTAPELRDPFFDAVLTGPRLVLRPYVEARDIDFLSGLLCNPEVTAPMGIPAPAYGPEDIRKSKRSRMESGDSGDWTIFVRADKEDESDAREIIIGEIGIAVHDEENQIFEIFCAIVPEYGGKGYATEALSLLMEHIFRHSPIATIRVQTMATNERAIKLALRLGFNESGSCYIAPDASRGFVGGMYVTLDCRMGEFCECS